MPELDKPQGPSLEAASKAIAGLLSKNEEREESEVQPEQVPEKVAEEPKQVPAATEEGSEQAEPESEAEGQEAEPSQPRTVKVKVDGEEIEVTEDELRNGYSRTQDYTRKTQQLAEQRREFEEREVAAVRQERQQYSSYLDQLKTQIETLRPKEPDWEKLRGEVAPDVFAAELLHWQQTSKHLEKIEAEQARVKALQEEDARKGFEKHLRAEQERLQEKLPDMKDPEKAKVLKTELSEFAKTLGFSDDDLAQVTDHRLILLLNDAMQFRKGQAAKPKIQSKIEKAMTPSAPGSRTRPEKEDKLTQAKERLKKTGSLDDGARAIAALLG